ncbi:ribonuclease H-like domain-containing protein [Tanacetum coccineum]
MVLFTRPHGGIPLNMWTEYVLTATYLINRLPTSVLNGKSPYDLVYNKPHSLKHLRSFDCLAHATILNSHDKFGSRSKKCVLVGYSNSKKRYKLWSLDNKEVIYSRDVKFFEDMFPFKKNISTGIDKSLKDVNHLNFLNFNTLDDLPEIPNDEERRNPSPIRNGHSQDSNVSASENESFAADEDKNSSSEGNGLHDQSQDNVSQDNNGVQNLISMGNYCFAIMHNKGVEPKTYLKASQHKHQVDPMNAEMDALYKIIHGKLLIFLLEERLLGIDFDETFSPVVKIVIVRCLINLAVQSAPRQWNAKLTVALLENNFVQSKSDYSLFTKSFGDVFIALLPNISLTSEPSDTDPLLDNVTGYQKLIGKLIYLTTTRPDIAYTVSCLSQFMHNPLKSHLKTALKVIRYLKGSPGKGINVIKGSASIIDLKAYSDADWERCVDTRRSITGYCVFMCGSLVS